MLFGGINIFMNYFGIMLGLVMLITTGLGHVVVIKGEYHFGMKFWPIFLIIGVLSMVLSLIVKSPLLSGILGINGITFLWGILELFHQRERVRKGWFPKKHRP
jgi:hypothetical protein